MAFIILRKIQYKLMIDFLPFFRSDRQLHVNPPTADSIQTNLLRDQHILVIYPVTAQLVQFSYWGLVQPSVLDMQLPWKTHLPKPRYILCSKITSVPVLHPSDHNAASIRRQHCLRRIKINTIINRLIMPFRECVCLFIIITNQAECPVSVMILKSLRKHILRTDKQYCTAVEHEEIRTFPHKSKAVVVFCEHLLIFP